MVPVHSDIYGTCETICWNILLPPSCTSYVGYYRYRILIICLLPRYLEPDLKSLLEEEMSEDQFSHKFEKLNNAIAGLVREKW